MAYHQADSRDPFSPGSLAYNGRYNDNDSDNNDHRRDTFTSDSTGHGADAIDGERYYDQNGAYDPYGEHRSTAARLTGSYDVPN
jgi:hypothetical protein